MTREQRIEFLRHLTTSGRLKYAARRAGVTGSKIDGLRRESPEFDALVDQAISIYESWCWSTVKSKEELTAFETSIRGQLLKKSADEYDA